MEKREYDERQREVIDAGEGYHLVLAPPGCGKTEVLAERILRAHQRGVAYGDMLCLTFTNRASRSMRERIEQMAGDSLIMRCCLWRRQFSTRMTAPALSPTIFSRTNCQ